MVILNNNWIIIDNSDTAYFSIKLSLIKKQGTQNLRLKNGHMITKILPDFTYYTEVDDKLFIPIGLLSFIEDYIRESEVIDKRHKCDWKFSKDIFDYREMLEGISLRDEQLLAIRKAVVFKRGILQLPTGAGKTEIMCGIIKVMDDILGKCPTTLILEPTINLVNSTIKRFEKYNIPVTRYNDNRCIIENKVNICHPSSLGNDIDKNPNLLDSLTVMIGDEAHHFNSEQFRKPTYNIPNLEMSIGVSASAISQDHVGYKELNKYDIKEGLAFSATGPLLMNVVTGSMIEGNRLANPVLFVMKNEANEFLPEFTWHNIERIRLEESEVRNNLIAECAKFFASKDRKTLILVRTVKWSQLLLKEFHRIGISDIVGASYGGGKFEYYNGSEFITDNTISSRFESGNIKILIGTTHLYEGADIPNLDAMILAYGGKGERLQIQGIGRVLRLTKNGKYAYIVDFTDDKDPVLSKHLKNRMKRYKDIIGIPADKMFYNIDVFDISNIFEELEGC